MVPRESEHSGVTEGEQPSRLCLLKHAPSHTLRLSQSSGVLRWRAGCIGPRFATAESVYILALLVRQCEVLVPAGQDKEDKEDRAGGEQEGASSLDHRDHHRTHGIPGQADSEAEERLA
ncbi:hypothetical protein FIBSPDRAFT_1035849 [Athelia psychrophila]|uniref:Uncharacterized protein n=1 Tax=Athelia psychrophila TaxID=1759441 RepID=A0A166WLM7_9AGAM|nr:hypothetical protein FIBSPDRAFT_1035849 [Fibularhizoctonia sp. CBS 109695]